MMRSVARRFTHRNNHQPPPAHVLPLSTLDQNSEKNCKNTVAAIAKRNSATAAILALKSRVRSNLSFSEVLSGPTRRRVQLWIDNIPKRGLDDPQEFKSESRDDADGRKFSIVSFGAEYERPASAPGSSLAAGVGSVADFK